MAERLLHGEAHRIRSAPSRKNFGGYFSVAFLLRIRRARQKPASDEAEREKLRATTGNTTAEKRKSDGRRQGHGN